MAKTYEPIATVDVSGVTSYTFSSIPSTYTDLRLVLLENPGCEMYFNGDNSSSNYGTTFLSGNGSAVSTSVVTGMR